MIFLVPTRNNHQGLAGLLSSIIAVTSYRSLANKDTLIISDGSDSPVVSDPHVSRLLTHFNLRYAHTTTPHVNEQRLTGLSLVPGDSKVCLVDDDHILLTDPVRALTWALSASGTLFGVAVDTLNDKGYRDYAVYGSEPGIHNFCHSWAAPTATFAAAHANPGFMLCEAGPARKILAVLHQRYPDDPSIADDAWAQLLCGHTPTVHESMQAIHVGNTKRWWNQQGHKHAAVAAAVSNYQETQQHLKAPQ